MSLVILTLSKQSKVFNDVFCFYVIRCMIFILHACDCVTSNNMSMMQIKLKVNLNQKCGEWV